MNLDEEDDDEKANNLTNFAKEEFHADRKVLTIREQINPFSMSSTTYFKHVDPASGIHEIYTGVKDHMPQPDFSRVNHRKDSSILKRHLMKGLGKDPKFQRSNSTNNVMQYDQIN